MSEQLLQIVAECGYVTTDTPSGRSKVLLMKGAVFPASAPEAKHLLDSGMAVPVGGDVTGGVDADGNPDAATHGDAPKADEAPRDTPSKTGAKAGPAKDTDAELAALRKRAVAAGMDRAEVDKASAADLRAAFGEK